MKQIFSSLIVLVYLSIAVAAPSILKEGAISPGAISIGGTTIADSKSLLDIQSTTKGILLPRMTSAQRTAILTPPAGLMVYDTDLGTEVQYDGAAWRSLANLDGTQTFSNKTLSATNNTISDLADANLSATAAINRSKIAIGTLGRVVMNDPTTGALSESAVTSTELGYLTGTTSSVQTQLNAKASGTDLSNHTSATTSVHGIADTANLATLAGTQTLSNKTLTNPLLSGSLSLEELGTSPAAPPAGQKFVFAKTDGKVYTKDSAGAEKPIGSGTGAGAAELSTVLANSGFEENNPLDGWTLTAGTSAAVTDRIEGEKAVELTLSAVTGTVLTQEVTPGPSLAGSNLEFTLYVKTALANVQVCAMNAGAEAFCGNVSSSNLWAPVKLNFPAPSSGTIGIRLKSTASVTGSIKVDGAYVGMNRNVGIVSTARALGEVFAVSDATCPVGSIAAEGNSLSTTDYPELFAKLQYTHGGSGGSFNIPDTRGVFIRGSGSQTINGQTYSTTLGAKQNDATQRNGLSLTDPGHSHNLKVADSGSATSEARPDRPSGTFNHNSGYVSSSTTGITINDGDGETRPANVALKYCIQHAAPAEQAVRPHLVNAFAGKTWTTFNHIDFSGAAATGTRTTVTHAAEGANYTLYGIAQNDASQNAQVTATLPAGEYVAQFTALMRAVTGAGGQTADCMFDVYDGTNVIASAYISASTQANASVEDTSTISAPFKLTSQATKTFTVRMAKVGGDVSGQCQVYHGGMMSLVVKPVTQNVPAPLLVNSVVSPDYGGVTRINTARSITSSVTLGETDETVMVDASGGAVTVALPAAASFKGKRFTIKKSDSSGWPVTIGGTIDGFVNFPIEGQHNWIEVQSDGGSWRKVAQHMIVKFRSPNNTTSRANGWTNPVTGWTGSPVVDNASGWDGANNRYVVQVPGRYWLHAAYNPEGNGTGGRGAAVTGCDTGGGQGTADTFAFQTSCVINLNVGDHIYHMTYQSSGGTRTTNLSQFSLERISD